MRGRSGPFAALVIAFCVLGLSAQDYPRTDVQREWNKPVEPFRIIGSIHYVGTYDLASYLITTPAGHMLVDSGLETSAAQLMAAIQKLGFALTDIKLLLNTQAHFDHAAGLATLKKLTGARMLASAGDAPFLESGGKNDPALGNGGTFAPVRVDRIVTHGERVTLGDVTLTAHMTPGHSKGTTTWTMTVAEGGRELQVIFAGSTSIANPEMEVVDNPRYPTLVDDYKRTFAYLKGLKPDVFLTQHASAFGLHDKAARLKAGAKPNPFIDPAGYTRWLMGSERSFLERLATK